MLVLLQLLQCVVVESQKWDAGFYIYTPAAQQLPAAVLDTCGRGLSSINLYPFILLHQNAMTVLFWGKKETNGIGIGSLIDTITIHEGKHIKLIIEIGTIVFQLWCEFGFHTIQTSIHNWIRVIRAMH